MFRQNTLPVNVLTKNLHLSSFRGYAHLRITTCIGVDLVCWELTVNGWDLIERATRSDIMSVLSSALVLVSDT